MHECYPDAFRCTYEFIFLISCYDPISLNKYAESSSTLCTWQQDSMSSKTATYYSFTISITILNEHICAK